MSLIHALSKELEARSDESLRALFSARPDLISPGVPDFAALAARASGRVSVQRALERLNRPQMQELALVQRAEPPHGTAPAAAKHRFYLPVGSLRDVVGIYPAGLGRSYTELVRLQP